MNMGRLPLAVAIEWRKSLARLSISFVRVERSAPRGLLRSGPSVLVLATLLVAWGVGQASPVTERTVDFDVPSQRADQALTAFAEQANVTLVFPYDLASRSMANQLVGVYGIADGLRLLLEGTSLSGVVESGALKVVARVESTGNRTSMKNESRRWGVLGIVLGLFTSGVHGEEGASDTPIESGSPGLAEVTVTARKFTERLRDVPLAITAFTAEEISSAGIADLDDVAMATPGLNFISVLGEGLPTPVIRGVAPNNISAESSASIFVDGIYISGREGLNFSQLDLERIEVVKGPQSAIYGRNSFSGAINFITAAPTKNWENRVEATAGSDDRYGAKLVLSGPMVGEKLGLRLAFGHDQSGGTYKNSQAGGGDIGGSRTDSIQARLVYTPTDQLRFDVIGYYSDDHIDPAAAFTFLPNCEDANLLTGAPGTRPRQFCGEVPMASSDRLKVNRYASGQDREVRRISGVIAWTGAAGTLTSVTAHSSVDFRGVTDYLGDRGNEGMVLLYTTAAGTPGVFRTGQLVANTRGNSTREFSQELRFATPQSARARAIVGTYFYDTERDTSRSNFYNTEPLPVDFGAFVSGSSFAGAFVNDLNPPPQRLETSRAIAGFGALEGDLSRALTTRMEVRYTAEDKGFLNYTDSNPLTRTRNRTWDAFTWRFSADYKLSEEQMLYASVARGAKSGDFSAGTDRLAPGSPLYVLPYDGEKIYAYEVGSKGVYFDRRLALEASAYYYDWRDIVLFQALPGAPGLPPFVTPEITFYTNSGDVRITGFELTSQLRLSPRLTAGLGASWTDATIATNAESVRVLFRGFPSLAPTGNVGGNTAQRQSKLQAAASVSYLRPLNSSLSLMLRGDVNYKGKQFIDETNMAWIGPRTVVNARVGVQAERYSVELWAQNLLNDRTPNSVIGQTFIGNTEMQANGSYRFDGANTLNARRFDATLNPLRQVGVTFKYHF